MLKEYLKTMQPPLAVWTKPASGVEVCRFALDGGAVSISPALAQPRRPLQFETLFCCGGALLVRRSGGRLMRVEEGGIFLLSEETSLHCVEFSGGLRGILVAVDAPAARESFAALCAAMGLAPDTQVVRRHMREREGCAVLPASPWTQAVFDHLEQLSAEEQGRYCVLKAVEILYLLCTGHGLLAAENGCPGGYIARSTEQVRSYMQEHLSEKLTIARLSREFSLSPTSLKTAFRRMYGVSLHRWLIEERMKKARRLLQDTDLTIQQVAQEVGYDGVSRFNVAFKQRYGVTPGQFIKMSETGRTCLFR